MNVLASPCPHCMYDLTGVPATGGTRLCPECGRLRPLIAGTARRSGNGLVAAWALAAGFLWGIFAYFVMAAAIGPSAASLVLMGSAGACLVAVLVISRHVVARRVTVGGASWGRLAVRLIITTVAVAIGYVLAFLAIFALYVLVNAM